MIAVDHTGKTFGLLTAIRRVPNTGRRSKWECICLCGNTTEVPTQKLVDGRTKSCGCRNGLNDDDSCIQKILSIYKRNAKIRDVSFELTLEEIKSLVLSPCIYCGATESNLLKAKRDQRKVDDFPYNGIDRIDNALGYEPSNCVTACRVCNIMRGGLSQEDFLRQINNIHVFRETGVPLESFSYREGRCW